MKMIEPTPDEKAAYDTISDKKDKFGTFHKVCFHIHTPESYDYKLFSQWLHSDYVKNSEQDIYDICREKKILPEAFTLDSIQLENALSCYQDKKEFLSYILLADTIMTNEIEIVLVTDHHTIDGVNKLRTAINELHERKSYKVYTEVLLGIEISCADKNHVVGIFENDQEVIKKIKQWLEENLLSVEEGTYETSIKVLEFIKSINGIGYLAHLNSSYMIENNFLNGAYKKKLFSKEVLQVIGLSDYNKIGSIKEYIKHFRVEDINIVIDNDAHDIDTIADKVFWVKGIKPKYSMIKEALNDYDISVSFEKEEAAQQYIKGIYIKNREGGFLKGKGNDDFCLTFSKALNCLIGGRGTGKSTVLELLEYGLSQRCDKEEKLDFICSHGNTWILYEYQGEEFLIEMLMPVKTNPDDNILRCFGYNPTDMYGYQYHFKKEAVREYAFKNYFKISKVMHKDDQWYLEPVTDKRKMINRFFDVRYSVNDLVNTASDKRINSFIYNTMFENKTLSKPEDAIGFKKKSGLKKALNDVRNVMQKRKEEVEAVIKPFNISQKGKLKIVYSQDGIYSEPDFSVWLFGNKYNENNWYEHRNITKGNIIEYLLKLYSQLGIFEFLTLVINKDTEKAFSEVNFLYFCIEMTQDMVEHEINPLNMEEAKKLLSKILAKLITDQNIGCVINYLKEYIANVEKFSLEFNINNKAGSSGADFKSVEKLSLGQKVVAMLSFVLGYSEYSNDYRPLIIDQPEDNLDNQYIYKNLVEQLRSIKEKRQVIIATHNATIVTNAKADQVCLMDSDNQHGWVKTTGYPGERRIKKHIINHLEGGEESFLHKINIYEDALGIHVEGKF